MAQCTSETGRIVEEARETAYDGYFKIVRYRLRHGLFAGGMSGPIVREVFERGHSVAVLPYEPLSERVVLIEQFRMGPYAHGSDDPWLIELIAGVIDVGESPADVARREAREEGDLEFADLIPMLGYYVSPGGTSEHTQMFCGRIDEAPAQGIHGLDSENEDIRLFTLHLEEASDWIAAGRIASASALIGLQWLALNRDRVRRRWGIGDPA